MIKDVFGGIISSSVAPPGERVKVENYKTYTITSATSPWNCSADLPAEYHWDDTTNPLKYFLYHVTWRATPTVSEYYNFTLTTKVEVNDKPADVVLSVSPYNKNGYSAMGYTAGSFSSGTVLRLIYPISTSLTCATIFYKDTYLYSSMGISEWNTVDIELDCSTSSKVGMIRFNGKKLDPYAVTVSTSTVTSVPAPTPKLYPMIFSTTASEDIKIDIANFYGAWWTEKPADLNATEVFDEMVDYDTDGQEYYSERDFWIVNMNSTTSPLQNIGNLNVGCVASADTIVPAIEAGEVKIGKPSQGKIFAGTIKDSSSSSTKRSRIWGTTVPSGSFEGRFLVVATVFSDPTILSNTLKLELFDAPGRSESDGNTYKSVEINVDTSTYFKGVSSVAGTRNNLPYRTITNSSINKLGWYHITALVNMNTFTFEWSRINKIDTISGSTSYSPPTSVYTSYGSYPRIVTILSMTWQDIAANNKMRYIALYPNSEITAHPEIPWDDPSQMDTYFYDGSTLKNDLAGCIPGVSPIALYDSLGDSVAILKNNLEFANFGVYFYMKPTAPPYSISSGNSGHLVRTEIDPIVITTPVIS